VRDGVVTTPPVGLTFGVTAGPGSELLFGVDALGAGTATVEWTPDGGAPRALWSREIPAGQAVDEQSVELPAGTGRLRLGFTGPAGVRWRRPRVRGSEPPPVLLSPPPSPPASGTAMGPLVLVVLDAARAQQLGTYGYRRPTSPRIDEVASEGLVVDNAYTTAVFTLSAMSSLWTSLPPELHHAGVPYDGPLPPDHLTLAELLAAAGYRTAGFVGNARAGSAYGMERGFAHWVESRQQSVGAGAHELVEAARAWIREQPDARFFLYVHLREPHFPYAPPAPWDALFARPGTLPEGALTDPAWYRAVNAARSLDADQRDALVRAYDRNLAFADAKTGELVDELRARGHWEPALAVITSDHGEALGEHGFISHNEQVYEESTRIPMVVKLPGRPLRRGRRHPGLATTLDVAPTFAEAAGVAGRATSFRGRSLLALQEDTAGASAAVSRAAGEESLYGVRYGSWKCVVDTRWGGEELYDLAQDPGERHELSALHPGRMAECRQALHRHLLELRPPRPSTLRTRPLDPAQVENLRALGYVQ
jgi:arylsulfatase A-like enzyme